MKGKNCGSWLARCGSAVWTRTQIHNFVGCQLSKEDFHLPVLQFSFFNITPQFWLAGISVTGYRYYKWENIRWVFKKFCLATLSICCGNTAATRFCAFFLGRYSGDVKPRLHWNANRTRMRHSKMMRMFDVDMLLRRGKQHLAVQRMFGQWLNVICRLSVHLRGILHQCNMQYAIL